MSNSYIERELVFDFPAKIVWKELDKQGVMLPKGMSLVDLVIEREHDILLVEIKDPSNSRTPDKERKKYLKRLQDNSVLTDELVPKVRDSYTHEHLMGLDTKPFRYIVILGLDAFSDGIQKALLHNFSDRLFGNIRHESQLPWVRKHIEDCIVMSIDEWNRTFTDWPIKRVPT